MSIPETHPRVVKIPKHVDARGNLSVVDQVTCLPFSLQRIFYVYDIPAATERGAHAHYTLHQFLWCVTGSVEVRTIARDGSENSFVLSLPWTGLYLPPMVWASEKSLTAACTYFVAASSGYDEKDYIRDFDQFQQLCKLDSGS